MANTVQCNVQFLLGPKFPLYIFAVWSLLLTFFNAETTLLNFPFVCRKHLFRKVRAYKLRTFAIFLLSHCTILTKYNTYFNPSIWVRSLLLVKIKIKGSINQIKFAKSFNHIGVRLYNGEADVLS